MKIKCLFFIIFFIGFLHVLPADNTEITYPSADEYKISFYAGINPLALIYFLPSGKGTAGTVYGSISGQEYGISLYGGINLIKANSIEMRFSTGLENPDIWDTQIQLGYIWFPFNQFFDWNGGLCTGLMLRNFFWNSIKTDYFAYSFMSDLMLGWRFIINSLAIDIRGGWNLSFVTRLNTDNSNVAAGWPAQLGHIYLTLGIAWTFESKLGYSHGRARRPRAARPAGVSVNIM